MINPSLTCISITCGIKERKLNKTLTRQTLPNESIWIFELPPSLTAVVDQTHHKKGRRAKPRNWFYIFIEQRG